MNQLLNRKRCGRCKHPLPATSKFYANDATKRSGLSSYCRVCKRLNDRIRKRGMQEWFRNLKKSKKCKWCSESRWYVLDFHHRNGTIKKAGIAQMVHGSKYYTKEDVLKEIKKCNVLCANCHREKHFVEHVQGGGSDLIIKVIN